MRYRLILFLKFKSGVPRSSNHASLLFLIYINDVPNDITKIIRLFADDTSIYVLVATPALAEDRLI